MGLAFHSNYANNGLFYLTSGNIYVGGTFTSAGGSTANNVAYYNGSWSALVDTGTSIDGTNNELRAMEIDTDGSLLVGGNFGSAGGKTANRIARWNGSTWSNLGIGTSGFVQAILATSDAIYLGGNFLTAGNQTVNRIAKYVKANGSWASLGNGLSGSVNALEMMDNRLIVGGAFKVANNAEHAIIVNHIATWDDALGWQGCGTTVGTNGPINALSFEKSQVFAAGNFTTAGGQAVGHFDAWQMECCPSMANTNAEANRIIFDGGNIASDEILNIQICFDNSLFTVSTDTSHGNVQTDTITAGLSPNAPFEGAVQFTLSKVSRLTCVYGEPTQTCGLLTPCGSMILNSDVPMINGSFLESSDWMELSGTINPSHLLFFRAADEIRFSPSFEVQHGGQLTARIGPCTQ